MAQNRGFLPGFQEKTDHSEAIRTREIPGCHKSVNLTPRDPGPFWIAPFLAVKSIADSSKLLIHLGRGLEVAAQ